MNHLPLFIYGTLADTNVQKEVLGRSVIITTALLSGYKVQQGKWPYIVPRIGSFVSGWLIEQLSEEDWAKLDAYEEIANKVYVRQPSKIISQTADQGCVYFPVLENWQREWLEPAKHTQHKANNSPQRNPHLGAPLRIAVQNMKVAAVKVVQHNRLEIICDTSDAKVGTLERSFNFVQNNAVPLPAVVHLYRDFTGDEESAASPAAWEKYAQRILEKQRLCDVEGEICPTRQANVLRLNIVSLRQSDYSPATCC